MLVHLDRGPDERPVHLPGGIPRFWPDFVPASAGFFEAVYSYTA